MTVVGRLCFSKISLCLLLTLLLLYLHTKCLSTSPPRSATERTELCGVLLTLIAWQMNAPHTFIPQWNYNLARGYVPSAAARQNALPSAEWCRKQRSRCLPATISHISSAEDEERKIYWGAGVNLSKFTFRPRPIKCLIIPYSSCDCLKAALAMVWLLIPFHCEEVFTGAIQEQCAVIIKCTDVPRLSKWAANVGVFAR